MSPFTNDVLQTLELLRRAIADVSVIDAQAADTLTAITDDLVINLENQMLLVFANVGIKRKQDEEALLKSRSDASLLQSYREACGSSTEVQIDAASGKLHVPNMREPVPTLKSFSEPAALSVDVNAQRTLLASVHMLLESLGHTIGTERNCLYLSQRGTGTLRIISSAPDIGPARRGAFVPAHQGIVGAVFSTGVAIRADSPAQDTLRVTVEPIDVQLGFKTRNFITFPVLDKSTNLPVAVIECANKVGGFSAADETTMTHACRLMWYLICYHDIDFHNGMIFNPAPLHNIRPYKVDTFEDLKLLPGAAAAIQPQLVVRLPTHRPETTVETVAKQLGLAQPTGEIPLAVKGYHTPENAVDSDSVKVVRELKSYITKVEDAHKDAMNELVRSQQRETSLREEVAKKSNKLRVLEDNATALHDQLMEAKQSVNKHSFSPIRDSNAAEFDASMHLGSFLTTVSDDARLQSARSSVRHALPPIAHRSFSTDKSPADRRTMMNQAAKLLEDLRRTAHAPIPFSKTPQPKLSKRNGRVL
jgi:hypothetical protein